jgi:hypothetical protein
MPPNLETGRRCDPINSAFEKHPSIWQVRNLLAHLLHVDLLENALGVEALLALVLGDDLDGNLLPRDTVVPHPNLWFQQVCAMLSRHGTIHADGVEVYQHARTLENVPEPMVAPTSYNPSCLIVPVSSTAAFLSCAATVTSKYQHLQPKTIEPTRITFVTAVAAGGCAAGFSDFAVTGTLHALKNIMHCQSLNNDWLWYDSKCS